MYNVLSIKFFKYKLPSNNPDREESISIETTPFNRKSLYIKVFYGLWYFSLRTYLVYL